MALPLVHGDLAEDLAAVEPVVREPFFAIVVRVVGHGFVDQGGQGGSFHRGEGVGAGVAQVALLVGEELEFPDAGPDADERSDVPTESAVGLDDVVVGFFARVVAAEAAVFEPHGWEGHAAVSGQDPDRAEVRRCGRGRVGHFVQGDR